MVKKRDMRFSVYTRPEYRTGAPFVPREREFWSPQLKETPPD